MASTTMKPRILFLTNTKNDSPEEDRVLIDFLAYDFDLMVFHPLDCLNALRTVQGVIIRNIWPTHEYVEGWEDIKNYLRISGIPVYNPLVFRGDVEGKDYLVVLHDKGYPVIPSVDRISDLSRLPKSDFYWIKPKRSCDGIGAKKLSREQLIAENPVGYIIQPFLDFESEPSFFFIDNIFHHALFEKNRLSDDRVRPHITSRADIKFAQKFIQWSGLPYGTQRIDAVRMKDGRLLLTEIENLCPYLYLTESGDTVKRQFLEALRKSLLTVFKSK